MDTSFKYKNFQISTIMWGFVTDQNFLSTLVNICEDIETFTQMNFTFFPFINLNVGI